MATREKKFPLLKGNWKVLKRYEAASQAFVRGDFVKVANGQVTIGSAAGSDFTSSSTIACGIANQAASGTTNAEIEIMVPVDDTAMVSLPVQHGTPSSAVTNKDLIGDKYVLTNISATEGWAVAIDTTTNPLVQVSALDIEQAEGELNGRVWVKPISAFWETLI